MREPLVMKALSLNDRAGEAYVSLAFLRRGQGRQEEAMAACQRAMELSPNYPLLYAWCSGILAGGNVEVQFQLLKKALELDPRSVHRASSVAWHLQNSGRFDEALAYARKAVELGADDASGRLILGVLLTIKDEYADGLRHLEKAAALDPRNPLLSDVLVFTYAMLGDNETAEEWANETWQRAPDPGNYFSCAAKSVVAILRGQEETVLECARQQDDAWFLALLRDNDLSVGRDEEARARYYGSNPELFDINKPVVTSGDAAIAVDLSLVLYRTEESELANSLLQHALDFIATSHRPGTTGYAWLDVEIYALKGEKEKALTAMRNAIDDGYSAYWWMLERRLNLQSLWDEPVFKAMMAELKESVREKREEMTRQLAAKNEGP